ncbi:MAG: hypothetical protein ABSF91_08635 [Bacteroidota bacterium]|jgi:hypothetical protein
MRIGPLILGGNMTPFDIPVMELKRDGIFLTFPEEATLHEGEVLWIVRWIGSYRRPRVFSFLPRRIVATVKILKITDGTRAFVQVLKGSVAKGFCAEKVPLSYSHVHVRSPRHSIFQNIKRI